MLFPERTIKQNTAINTDPNDLTEIFALIHVHQCFLFTKNLLSMRIKHGIVVVDIIQLRLSH